MISVEIWTDSQGLEKVFVRAQMKMWGEAGLNSDFSDSGVHVCVFEHLLLIVCFSQHFHVIV